LELKQEDSFSIVMFKHQDWKEAGGIHAPLQHQVGDFPDESEIAGRNRERFTQSS
jgi:hypothetical protein